MSYSRSSTNNIPNLMNDFMCDSYFCFFCFFFLMHIFLNILLNTTHSDSYKLISQHVKNTLPLKLPPTIAISKISFSLQQHETRGDSKTRSALNK